MKRGFLVVVSLMFLAVVYGQEIPNVEFLSDQEINQYWGRAKGEGYSIDEVKTVAMSRGMSAVQADLLVSRIQTLNPGISGGSSSSTSSLRSVNNSEDLGFFLTGQENEQELTPLERKLFGYKAFRGKNLSFNPNLNMATPTGYIVGPGDEILVEVYGTSQESYSLLVSPDGKILIPRIGPVSIGGLTIEAAKGKLKSSLAKLYQGLRDNPAKVFLDVTLGNLRTIKINVLGEVKKPGTYALPSFVDPFAVLYAAGGPTVDGTFRNISLYRAGKLVGNIDLYAYLTTGRFSLTGMLQDGDMVIVSPYGKRIEVIGEVKIPGLFEVKDGESLDDFIKYAGGLTPSAQTKSVTLERLNGESQTVKDISLNQKVHIPLLDGDRILIRQAVDPLVEKIQVEGAVLHPGSFGWSSEMTLEKLIMKSGGFLPEAYLERATLFRKKGDLSTEALPLNLDSIDLASFKLEIGDLVFVASQYKLKETNFVEILGEVKNPGIVPFFSEMTIADALLLTSGLKQTAIGGSIELVRNPENPGGNYQVESYKLEREELPFGRDKLDIVLEPFDRVFIRQSSGYEKASSVQIKGEVNSPGTFILENRDASYKDLIERAQGYTDFAFAEGVYILRRNESLDVIQDTKLYLQKLTRLNNFLNDQLLGGTLSEVERTAITNRIVQLQDKYRALLKDSGRFTADSLIAKAMDSILLETRFNYDKVAISKKKIRLQDGDIIIVPTKPETVKVSGEVLQVNTVSMYDNGKPLRSYIGDAGGYNSDAKRNKVFVRYANGSAAKTRNFLFFKNSPKIKAGSEIIVPGGRVRENFNIDRLFGLVTTAATTYLLFLTIQDRQSQ